MADDVFQSGEDPMETSGSPDTLSSSPNVEVVMSVGGPLIEPDDEGADVRKGSSAVVRAARQDAYQSFKSAILEDTFFASLRPDVAARMQTYLLALVKLSYQTKACAVVGINAWAVRRWRKEYPRFIEYEQVALESFVEVMEQEADRRAIEGWLEPVWSHKTGQKLGHIRKYDSRLLETRLRALAPDKYADRRKTELTGKDGGPVQVQPVMESLKEKLDRLRQQ